MTKANAKVNPPSTAMKILNVGLWSVGAPFSLYLFGALVAWAFPGCSCDATSCKGCGANFLIGILVVWGLAGTIITAITVLPITIIVATLVKINSALSRE